MINLVLGANTVITQPQCTVAFSTSGQEKYGQQLGMLWLPLDERRKAIYSPVYLHHTSNWADVDDANVPSEWQLDLETLFDKGVHYLQLLIYVYHIPDINLPAIEIKDIDLTINKTIHYTFKSNERHVKAAIVLEIYKRKHPNKPAEFKCRALGETSIQGLDSLEQHVETSLDASHPYKEEIIQQAQAQQNINPNTLDTTVVESVRPPRQVEVGKKWTGTAFAIDPYHLLTCYHLIESASLLGIRQQGQPDREVQVVMSDVGSDMALLKVSEPLPSYLTLASQCGDILGESITTLGFPLSGLNSQLQVTQGCISGLTGFRDDIRYMQFTAPIQPGSSGSPLLLPTGEVVGMVTASLSQAQNMNYAVKFHLLAALLTSAGIGLSHLSHQSANRTFLNRPPQPSATRLTTPELSRQSRSALWLVGAQA